MRVCGFGDILCKRPSVKILYRMAGCHFSESAGLQNYVNSPSSYPGFLSNQSHMAIEVHSLDSLLPGLGICYLCLLPIVPTDHLQYFSSQIFG